MAIGKKSPTFPHHLQRKAMPQRQMQSSTQKLLKAVTSARKPTTTVHRPTSSLHSPVEQEPKTSRVNFSTSTTTSLQQQNKNKYQLKHPFQPPKQLSEPPTQSSLLKRKLRSSSFEQGSASTQQESASTINVEEPSQVGFSPTLDDITNTIGGKVHKRVRGETRCLEYSKRKRDGVQFDIDIPKHVMRAVGTNCQAYITGMGSFVRKNVPLQIKQWSDLPKEDVALLIKHVREKFNLSNEYHVDEAIETHMMRYFNTWRYNLHKVFEKYESVEEAMENRPTKVDEDDWNFLIANLWQDEKWLAKSERNKKNRDKLHITHCAGTKAFSRLRTENRNPETGEEVGRINLFKLTRYSEKKSAWVGDTAKNAFEEMENLQKEPPINEKSGEIMSEDEIYDQVLTKFVGPPRSGYVRGLGAGPKPKRSRSANDAQVKEANQRAEQAEMRAKQLAEELEAVKADAAQQNEELEAVKVRANQQNEELEALKARQGQTDTLILQLMAKFSS